MRIFLASFLLSLLLVGCNNDSPTNPNAELSLETLVQAPHSGFSEPQRMTVRDAGEWAEVWQTLHAGLQPVPALPAMDFDGETVVVVAAGTRSNGCYSIAVTAATLRTETSVELEVTETVPGPACACTQALTQPVHAVGIDRAVTSASFIERVTELPC